MTFLSAPAAFSADTEKCFDFSTEKVAKTIVPKIELVAGGIATENGTREKDKAVWGSARALVNLSANELYDWFQDHTNWKDMSRTKVKTIEEKSAIYNSLHKVFININVWAFIVLDWVESWAYLVTDGTPEKKKEFFVTYQKDSGSFRLTKLCGSVAVKEVEPSKSDLYFYEEAIAQHYEPKDITHMHQSFYARLGDLAKKRAAQKPSAAAELAKPSEPIKKTSP